MPRDARGYALLPLVPHQPSAFLRRSSSPGAKFSVRLQETEAARRVIPPSSHARLRLRIPGRGAGGQSATSGSKHGALVGAQGRYPSLTRASLSLPGAGPVSVKPEPLDSQVGGHASRRPRPFERFTQAPPPATWPSTTCPQLRCAGQRPLGCWNRLRVGLDW